MHTQPRVFTRSRSLPATAKVFAFFGLILMTITFAATPARAVAKIQTVTSEGGIAAWLVEDYTLPLLSINFAFKGGAAQDAAGKAGTANLLSGLLDEGAGELEALAFQQRQQDLAMRLSFEAGRDAFYGSFSTLKENQAPSLELLQLSLTSPRFDTEPVERVRRQIIAGLQRQAKDPNSIASEAFSSLTFGDHPYGRSTSGSLESVPNLNIDDLRRYVKRNFARDNLVVGVVGAISADELAKVLDQVFGGLPATSDLQTIAEAQLQGLGQTMVIDYDIPQSIMRLAMPGLKRDDPDFMAAFVLNHIYGGGTFSSRLFREVREARGLAYSVYSYLMPLDHAGLLAAGVATKNEAAKVSLDLIAEEARKLRETPPTEVELDEAKAFIKGSYQLRFDTSSKIARNLVGLQLEGLPIDYIEVRNDLIEAITLDDLQRVANRLLRPENMITVVVGKPEGVVSTN
jgi:zinc protease